MYRNKKIENKKTRREHVATITKNIVTTSTILAPPDISIPTSWTRFESKVVEGAYALRQNTSMLKQIALQYACNALTHTYYQYVHRRVKQKLD